MFWINFILFLVFQLYILFQLIYTMFLYAFDFLATSVAGFQVNVIFTRLP